MCLSVRDHIFKTTRPIFVNFFCMSATAVARSYSGGVVIHYVFPVLWTTSCLHIYTGKLRLLDVAARLTADDRDYFLQSWPTRPQWVR